MTPPPIPAFRANGFLACATSVLIVSASLLGCTGSIAELDGFDLDSVSNRPSDVSPVADARDNLPARACGERQVDQTPARLLTRLQYNNAVRDLLGDATRPLKDSPSADTGAFDNDAQSLSISVPMAQHFIETAQDIAQRAMQDPNRVVDCGGAAERECAELFISTFGRRAFRKPVPSAEEDALIGLYDATRERSTFNESIELLIVAMLNSPHFLYHLEQGGVAENGIAQLTDHEIASKLSFFLTGSIPDAELAEAADNGQLSSTDGLRAHAQRLLQSQAARDNAAHMHEQWLEIEDVRSSNKDEDLYPGFTPEVGEALIEETKRFVEDVMWNNGTIADLFTSDYTMLNEELAAFYGVDGGMGADFAPRAHHDENRSGILTQGSIMTVQSKHGRTSPVHRGIFVREQILCETLPEAPDEIPSLDELDPSLPVRERLKQHREDAACAGCHSMMDPIGFAFENIDPVGRSRTHDEVGHPIDTTGEVVGFGDNETFAFANARELSAALATDPRVEQCVVKQWYRYAMSRTDDAHDACTISSILEDASTSGYRLQDIVLSIVTQDAFRFRTAVTKAPGACQ